MTHYKEAYAVWSGLPKGVPADPKLCCAEVWSDEKRCSPQCSRLADQGPENAYCVKHNPIVVATFLKAARFKIERINWENYGERNEKFKIAELAIEAFEEGGSTTMLEVAIQAYHKKRIEMGKTYDE